MKYIPTPKIVINNAEYTNELKGKTLVAGNILTTLQVNTLPNTQLNITVKSPVKTTGTSEVNMFVTSRSTLFGTKYNGSFTPGLENINSSSCGPWDIVDGKLYYNDEIVDSDTDWTILSKSKNVNIPSLTDNYIVYGLKDSHLYKLCLRTIKTPQPPIINITPLYAWKLNDVLIYTLNEKPNIGNAVYNWDGETLTTDGSIVYNVDDLEDPTEIYLSTNTDGYLRDVEDDDERIIETPQPDIITYELVIELVDTELTFKTLTHTVDWKYINDDTHRPYLVYGLTTDNDLVSISRDEVITLLENDVLQISDIYDSDTLLLEKVGGEIWKCYYPDYGTEDPTLTKLYTLPKKNSIILPGGSYGSNHPGVYLTICDGNLYAGQNCISNTGSWTQVSTGYECGYGIDDGKLYKIYGTNSQWNNKIPVPSDITLIDKSNIWIYVWCLYNTAYAFTSEGHMYYIQDINKTKQRTIPLGDWQTDYKEYTYTLDSGEESSTKQITIPIQLINELIGG